MQITIFQNICMATIAIVLFTVLVPTIYFGIQQSRLIANTYVQYFNSIGLETKKRGLFHFIIANGTYRNRKIQIKIRHVSRYIRLPPLSRPRDGNFKMDYSTSIALLFS